MGERLSCATREKSNKEDNTVVAEFVPRHCWCIWFWQRTRILWEVADSDIYTKSCTFWFISATLVLFLQSIICPRESNLHILILGWTTFASCFCRFCHLLLPVYAHAFDQSLSGKECFLVPSRFSNSCTSELPSQLQLTWGASLETRAADCNDCVGIFFGEIKVADFQEVSLSYVATTSPHGWADLVGTYLPNPHTPRGQGSTCALLNHLSNMTQCGGCWERHW